MPLAFAGNIEQYPMPHETMFDSASRYFHSFQTKIPKWEFVFSKKCYSDENEENCCFHYSEQAYIETVKVNEPVESDVTAEEWQLELERVMPLLKVSIKTSECFERVSEER